MKIAHFIDEWKERVSEKRRKIYAKLAHFFLSRPICDFVTWKFQSNRLVRSKFFDNPDKKHAMACKVCKNWAFQRNLLSSAHTHTQKNPKREWFAIWFLGAELSSLALYPKINANQHFRSTPSQNRFYIFGGRERMKHSGVC